MDKSNLNFLSFEELSKCTLLNINIFIIIIIFIICICCTLSFSNSLMLSMVPDRNIEPFTNNIVNGYNNNNYFSFENKNLDKYISVPLTSNDNMIFGEAKRYITLNSYILEIYANLYILNGNPFGKVTITDNTIIPQEYIVYLINTTSNDKVLVGKLFKDGDGIYKLKFKSNDIQKYNNYDRLEIAYKIGTNETILLKGHFSQYFNYLNKN